MTARKPAAKRAARKTVAKPLAPPLHFAAEDVRLLESLEAIASDPSKVIAGTPMVPVAAIALHRLCMIARRGPVAVTLTPAERRKAELELSTVELFADQTICTVRESMRELENMLGPVFAKAREALK